MAILKKTITITQGNKNIKKASPKRHTEEEKTTTTHKRECKRKQTRRSKNNK